MDEILLDVLVENDDNKQHKKDTMTVFGKYVCEESGLMRSSSLESALREVGIEDAGDLQASLSEDIPFEKFDRLVSLCTLQEHDFPSDQLESMFERLSSESSNVIDLQKVEVNERQRLERFLRSNGLSLEALNVKERISLPALQRKIAQELDDKRKADWLQETGVVKEIANMLPREVLQAAKGIAYEGSPGVISADVVSRLHAIAGLIEAKAKEKVATAPPLKARAWQSFSDRTPVSDAPKSPIPIRARSSFRARDKSRSKSPNKDAAPLLKSKHTGSLPYFHGSGSSVFSIGSNSTHSGSVNTARPEHKPSYHAHRRRTIATMLPDIQNKSPGRRKRKPSEERGFPHATSWLAPRRSTDDARGASRSLRGREGFGRWKSLTEGMWPTGPTGDRESGGSGSGGAAEAEAEAEGRWWEQYSNFRSQDVEWDEDAPSCRDRCALTLSWLSYEASALYRAVSWQLLAVTALIFVAALLGGGALVLYWARGSEEERKEEAVEQGRALSWFIQADVDNVLTALHMLGTVVITTRDGLLLASLADAFPPDPARPLTHRVVAPVPAQMQTDFATAVDAAKAQLHPEVATSFAGVTLAPRGVAVLQWGEPMAEVGFDHLSDPRRAAAVAAGGMLMLLPERDAAGRALMHVVLPLWQASGEQGTGGEGEGEGGKLWGLLELRVDLSALISMPRLQRPLSKFASSMADAASAEDDLVFTLASYNKTLPPPRSRDQGLLLLRTEGNVPTGERVVVAVETDHATESYWEFVLAWKSGFEPGWRRAGLVGVGVLSVVLALTVLFLLISRKQHRQLLYRIMPRRVVNRLKQGRQVAEVFDDVTIFFSDLVGFTDMSTRTSPLEVVMILNDLYTELDKIAARHQVFKVDTIGDAYMVIAGAPERCGGPEAAARVARFALDALEAVEGAGSGMQMRCGMASGSVVGAVLGTSVPKYSFFGDTVNTASRMESSGKPGRLQVTEATMEALSSCRDEFDVRERAGRMGVLVKGKGRLNTFWVDRRRPGQSLRPSSPLASLTARQPARLSVASAELTFSAPPMEMSNDLVTGTALGCEGPLSRVSVEVCSERGEEESVTVNSRARSAEPTLMSNLKVV